MKKIAILLFFFLALLVSPFSLPAYDYSPSNWKVIPECIWAPATGGGTWVTEIELTSMSATATVQVFFCYGGGLKRGSFTLVANLALYHSVKYSNILQTIDALDSGAFTYYGKVGAVFFYTLGPTFQVTAKTINGNYGKTFPGLSDHVAANTAATGRYMRITNLVNNAAYRTVTGFFNTSNLYVYTVTFTIFTSSYGVAGSSFTKTFGCWEYMAFNPFVQAGVGGGTYDNCWLFINVTGSISDHGIMCYGAIANNISNDPSAIIAYPY